MNGSQFDEVSRLLAKRRLSLGTLVKRCSANRHRRDPGRDQNVLTDVVLVGLTRDALDHPAKHVEAEI